MKKATFYFSHSGMVLKLLAALGLFKDDEGLSCSEKKNNRKWNTSRFDPFGANVAFVLSQCGDTFNVGLMVNERHVDIPGCGDCSFEDFKNLFAEMVDSTKCNFEELCSTEVNFSDSNEDAEVDSMF